MENINALMRRKVGNVGLVLLVQIVLIPIFTQFVMIKCNA